MPLDHPYPTKPAVWEYQIAAGAQHMAELDRLIAEEPERQPVPHGTTGSESHPCTCGAPLIRDGRRGRFPVRCESCQRTKQRTYFRTWRKAHPRTPKPQPKCHCLMCGVELFRKRASGRAPHYCPECLKVRMRDNLRKFRALEKQRGDLTQ